MTILDDLKAVYERVNPSIWYVVSDTVPIGKWLRSVPTEFFPEVHYFHPDDWAQVHRELTGAGCHLRDFRGWRPAGAKAPVVIDGEAAS